MESGYWDDDYELPPYHVYQKYIEEESPPEDFVRWLIGLDRGTDVGFYKRKYMQNMLDNGYDYQNLYDPECDTAIYYFLEDIVLEFDTDDDDEYYPYGWIDIYPILEKMGIKLPTFGDGGKYGKSMLWE